MTKRKLALVMGVLALVTVLGVVSVGAAFAQTGTPTTPGQPNATQPNPTQPNTGKLGRGFGFGFGFRGGDVTTFDTVAKALNLDPTELFNQLHAGKSLSEIATAQGKTLADVQAAVNASRVQAMKDKIQAAVTAGTITQDQANWLLQGLDKGYLGGGHGFGFGFGAPGRGMMMPRMRGFGNGGNGTQQPAPRTSGLGSSS
jgi:hypothetical protein